MSYAVVPTQHTHFALLRAIALPTRICALHAQTAFLAMLAAMYSASVRVEITRYANLGYT
eukprot:1918772-Pleurochrysis_carterae.AAC.1